MMIFVPKPLPPPLGGGKGEERTNFHPPTPFEGGR